MCTGLHILLEILIFVDCINKFLITTSSKQIILKHVAVSDDRGRYLFPLSATLSAVGSDVFSWIFVPRRIIKYLSEGANTDFFKRVKYLSFILVPYPTVCSSVIEKSDVEQVKRKASEMS